MKIQTSLKRIFISQTRLKLINIFFYKPEEIFYVRQLVRLTDEEINSVRRELDNLQKSGLINSERRGNRLYYWADKQSPLFTNLVIIANQSSGLGLKLQNKNETLGTIKLVFYSYRFMVGGKRGSDDIDLIIVGDARNRRFY
jgi:predicted transcriptional regulator